MLLLLSVFTEEFIEHLVDTLPGAGFINRSDSDIDGVAERLADNFNIPESDDDEDSDDSDGGDDGEADDDNTDARRKRQGVSGAFNPSEYVNALVSSLGDGVVSSLGEGNEQTELCIRRVANSVINGQAVANMARNIQEVRRAVTSLIRIGNFLEAQRNRLSSATFLDECVMTFIDLAFCSRCTERTPPLCFNTCNGLVRACYSPYYTTLNAQYSRLWTIAQRVIEVANTTVQRILADEADIIDTDTFVSSFALSIL